MFKKIVAVGLMLGMLSGCVGVDPQGRGYSVAIPLSAVNTTLANNFPVKERLQYGMFSGDLVISDPSVLSQEGSDKLGIGTSFKFSNTLFPQGIAGSIRLASGVRYDAQSKSLYLKDPVVNTIRFQNHSLLSGLPQGVQQAISVLIAQSIAKKPIYNLQQTTGVASRFVKGIDIENGQLLLTFGL